jgi:hypothetical protein
VEAVARRANDPIDGRAQIVRGVLGSLLGSGAARRFEFPGGTDRPSARPRRPILPRER